MTLDEFLKKVTPNISLKQRGEANTEALKDILTGIEVDTNGNVEIGGSLEVDGNITQNGGTPVKLFQYSFNFSDTYLTWLGNIDLTQYNERTIINEDSTWALNNDEILIFRNALRSGYCDIKDAHISSDFIYTSRSVGTTIDITSLKVNNNNVVPNNSEYRIDFSHIDKVINPSEYELIFRCIRLI